MQFRKALVLHSFTFQHMGVSRIDYKSILTPERSSLSEVHFDMNWSSFVNNDSDCVESESEDGAILVLWFVYLHMLNWMDHCSGDLVNISVEHLEDSLAPPKCVYYGSRQSWLPSQQQQPKLSSQVIFMPLLVLQLLRPSLTLSGQKSERTGQ